MTLGPKERRGEKNITGNGGKLWENIGDSSPTCAMFVRSTEQQGEGERGWRCRRVSENVGEHRRMSEEVGEIEVLLPKDGETRAIKSAPKTRPDNGNSQSSYLRSGNGGS